MVATKTNAMKHRYTIDELENKDSKMYLTDDKMVIALITERQSTCTNINAPLYRRLANMRIAVEKRMAMQANLPNGIDLGKLGELLAYSGKYEINIQHWPDQTAVYISKDGVDLQDYGGDFDFAVRRSLEYLNKITGKLKKK